MTSKVWGCFGGVRYDCGGEISTSFLLAMTGDCCGDKC